MRMERIYKNQKYSASVLFRKRISLRCNGMLMVMAIALLFACSPDSESKSANELQQGDSKAILNEAGEDAEVLADDESTTSIVEEAPAENLIAVADTTGSSQSDIADTVESTSPPQVEMAKNDEKPPAKTQEKPPVKQPESKVAFADDECLAQIKDVDGDLRHSRGDRLSVAISGPKRQLTLEDLVPNVSRLGNNYSVQSSSARQWIIVLGKNPDLGRFTLFNRKQNITANSSNGLVGGCSLTNALGHDLQKQFDARLKVRKAKLKKWATSGNAFYYYYLSAYMEGLLSMYEATGNKEYIELALEYAIDILNSGKHLDDDGYLDFHVKGKGLDDHNYALYEWRGFRPMSRLVRIINSSSELREQYPTEFFRLFTFIRIHVIEKWSELHSRNRKLPFFETDKLIHRLSHMGEILVDMSVVTKDPVILAALDTVSNRIKNQIIPNARVANAVEWNILFKDGREIKRDYSSALGVSDTSHASGTVAFVVAEAVDTRRVFDAQDLSGFTETLLKVIVTESNGKLEFADFVDGGTSTASPNTMGARNLSDGWVKLGRVDRSVQQLMLRVLADEMQPDKYMQLIGNIAKNFELNTWD